MVTTFSSRTWRSSGLKSVRVTPLRSRPFSWLMFGHRDRWIKSDSVSLQLVFERLSKVVLRYLGRNQAISSWKLRYQAGSRWETNDFYRAKVNLTIWWGSIHWLPSLILGWVLVTESLHRILKILFSIIKLSTTYSTSLWGWTKIMECTRTC